MKRSRIEVFRDGAGEWRWRFLAPNGKIMADSAEGYKTKFGASIAAQKLINYMRRENPPFIVVA